MQFVYKYSCRGIPVYVGITGNLSKRISEHERDRLSVIADPKIEYFCVKNRADAELLETYLINYYQTGNMFNIKKTKKGDVSFLGDAVKRICWNVYRKGEQVNVTPFIVDDVVISRPENATYATNKTIVPRKRMSDTEIIDTCQARQREDIEYLLGEIDAEKAIVIGLYEMLKNPRYRDNDLGYVEHGADLHRKRLDYMQELIGLVRREPFLTEEQLKRRDRLEAQLVLLWGEIETYEDSLRAQKKGDES